MIDLANRLANNYPVTLEQVLEYVDANINDAEMACKMRAEGISHNDALFVLYAGAMNLHLFKGQRYSNLARVYEKLYRGNN